MTALADLTLDVSGIYGSKITDVGMRYLAALKSLKKLCVLYCCRISDEGVGFLSDLVTLRGLSSSYSNVTGTGLKHLTCLTRLNLCF